MKRFVLAFACCALPVVALAQSGGEYRWEQFSKRIKASEKVSPLGVDLFGEQVSLSNGGLSFSATDVSLPGNNALAVSLTRTYEVRNRKYIPSDGMWGDWHIELPSVSAVGVPDWTRNGSNPGARCSDGGLPPTPASFFGTDLGIDDFWQGVSINIPGSASGELLLSVPGISQPTDGPSYKWVTSDGITHVSCLSSIKNGTGEGFLAITADGTRYWFDWMAQYQEPALRASKRFAPGSGFSAFSLPMRKNHLYVTRVEDRFGNYVNFTYTNAWNAPGKLSQISASDGRTLTIGYTNNRITSVSDGTRSWSYTYGTTPAGRATLTQVTQPDASKWAISFAGFTDAKIDFNDYVPGGEIIRSCTLSEIPLNLATQPVASITHPAGATGTYTVSMLEHGRSNVPVACVNVTTFPANAQPGAGNDQNDDVNLFATKSYSFSLKSKVISGPGLTSMTWNYSYEPNTSVFRRPGITLQYPVCTLGVVCGEPICTSDSCAGSSRTTITGPGGSWERHSYGNSYLYNEGKLLRVERGTGPSGILESTLHAYDLNPTGTPYPAYFGYSTKLSGDGYAGSNHRPLLSTTTTRDGVDFSFSNTAFDMFARPTARTRASTLGYSRTETFQYHDLASKWVMGQVKQITRNGVVESELTYDPTTALQLTYKHFGALRQTLTWNADGTVATVKDGNNNVTSLSNWYRGIPRNITHPGSVSQMAVVNGQGWVTSVIDENNYTTGYGYDPMGRLSSITYPTGDSTTWNTTTQAFAQVASVEYGIPAGHWRQTVTTGSGIKVTYFDGMWRPLLTREYDSGNAAGTQRFQRFSYSHDASGAVNFESYPGTTDALSTGKWSSYDAIGRLRNEAQSSELGTLNTVYAYLAGFQTRVTNPRSQQTTTSFQAWDQPTQDYPVAIAQPEGVYTDIVRDAFGKPTSITQRNAGSSLAVTRHYKYDAQHQLCKSVEPEVGSTVLDYDAAGNLAWSASGQALPSPTDCNRMLVAANQKVSRTYDARNRLSTLSFPDGNGNQVWNYTLDGLPSQVTTYNNAGASSVVNGYTYNKRRMLTGESQVQASLNANWSVGYGYNANGHLASLVYPTGLTVNYVPNALGQATQAGAFATGVQYYPNGAIKQFTYGSGVVHSMTQNARQLPARSTDSGDVVDLAYTYDGNGNVASITDHTTVARQTRSMSYDGRDRLLTVTSPLYTGGATYGYDVLDNLTRVTVAGRDHRYLYDARNRMTNVTNGAGGPSVMGLSYDVRGNLANRNGQIYTFDHGNRLRTAAGTETYRYDAHGRRVVTESTGGLLYEMYGNDGKLLWQRDELQGLRFQHVYLGGSLIASRRLPIGSTTESVIYRYTDALGSPIASGSETGVVDQRTEHEPYGKMLNRTNDNRPGYTGHMMDKATGLVYMQQRYYDNQLGVFLSSDPITAYRSPVAMFNRYRYASGNPYRYYDPDGRCTGSRSTNSDGTCRSSGEFTTKISSNRSVNARNVDKVFSHVSVHDQTGGTTPSNMPKQTRSALRKFLGSAVGAAVGAEAVKSGTRITLEQILPESGYPPTFAGGYAGTNEVTYSLEVSKFLRSNEFGKEFAGVGLDVLLAHEIGHTPIAGAAFGYTPVTNDADADEFNAVRHVENPYRAHIGAPLRTHYSGMPVPNPIVGGN